MDICVENLPTPIDRSLYQEATEIYLERSSNYIESLYKFGSVRYPGISDIDLLVVPKEKFLAPLKLSLLERLPPRFDCILEHNVYVVPRAHTAAFAFAHPQNLELLYGPDSLHQVLKDSSIAGRSCSELERLCNAVLFAEEINNRKVINATSCIRVFSAFRHTMHRLAEMNLAQEDGYASDMDGLIVRILESQKDGDVLSMFRRFREAVRSRASVVAARLGIDVTLKNVSALGRTLIPDIPGFLNEDAERRNHAIANYHASLAERHFYYGSMFMSNFHPRAPVEAVAFRVVKKGCDMLTRRRRKYQSGISQRGPATSL